MMNQGQAAGGAREAIAALIYEYAERLDGGNFGAVAALFEAASYRSAQGGEYRGRAAVLQVLTERVIVHGDGTPRTKHVTTNLTIDIGGDGGVAAARSYFTVLQQVDAGLLRLIVAGRYHDRFVCEGGQWRFTDRLIHVDLAGDLSQHLRATKP